MKISAATSQFPRYQLQTGDGPVECVPNEVILKMKSPELDTLDESFGGRVVERFSLGSSLRSESGEILRLKLDEGEELASSLRRLAKMPGVEYAVPNHVVRLEAESTRSVSSQPGEGVPDDLHPELWGLHNREKSGADISALEAWKKTTGSHQGPLIAVIDSGADYNHPDLRANIATNPGEIPGDGIDNDGNGVVDDYFGYNAIDDNGDPLDRRGHGTHVTGTIAAVGNNGQGVVGVNWKARILPIKIFNDEGVTTVDAILLGIAYARERGALITSNSWGGANFNPAIFDAFAATPGLHITAAGNDGGDLSRVPAYPANLPLDSILTVGATNKKDEPAVFSNFGRNTVELFAPGRDILSTMPGGKYGVKSGTSMACPHVTGVAGLIASAFPQLTPEQIKDRLIYSTDPLASVSEMSISGGRLNAARALSEDNVAPGAPNDFTVTSQDSRSARFSWTGTGDDGWKNGPATAFEVRVSEQPISEENWSHAESLSTPRGAEIGQFHHALFEQTPQKNVKQIYAGFKAVDEAGNRSSLRTAEATLPATPVAYVDNFDQPRSEWQGTGRWQHVEHPERGRVWSCQPDGPKDGTFARLTSPTFDLTGVEKSFLRFESRQDFDYNNLVYVDISEDGGKRWKRLDRLQDHGVWAPREYDLSEYDGKSIRLQISSETLATKVGEGTVIDNFEILGTKKAPAESAEAF
ncbi:MAG: S8 family serine peptidase [Candidatus Eremiobacteraeota bacterium]|nr:S8 family serine peptidase [Candidatus Eremiobacteraeota bacterium]